MSVLKCISDLLETVFIALKIELCMCALPPQDPRFNAEVDLITGYKTQSILCLPIKNHKEEVRQHTVDLMLRNLTIDKKGSLGYIVYKTVSFSYFWLA